MFDDLLDDVEGQSSNVSADFGCAEQVMRRTNRCDQHLGCKTIVLEYFDDLLDKAEAVLTDIV